MRVLSPAGTPPPRTGRRPQTRRTRVKLDRAAAPRPPRQLDAGPFQPQIGSFRLHLAAEGKAARTV